MWKWVSWVIRMGATALLLSFLCIWTTGYIVNSYLESVVKQLELPIEIQPMALSGVWGTLWGADRPSAEEAKASEGRASQPPEPRAENRSPEPSSSPGDGSGAEPSYPAASSDEPPTEETGKDEPGLATEETPDDALPVLGSDSGGNALTDEQRQSLYALVVSKLNPEQLQQLSDALKDGLTSEELSGLQEMLKTSLTDVEYSQMMELLQGGPEADTNPSPE